MASTKQTPVRLNPERQKRLDEFCGVTGLKKQTVLERALDRYLDEETPKKKRKRGA